MGEVLEAFGAALRSKKKAKELRRLVERFDRRATIIGVGRDAFPIVHVLRALGFDAYTVLPLSRQHPLARPVDRENPWAAREKLKKLIEEKGWMRKQARKLVRMIEEAAHSDTVILVDTGTAGTHPATVKMIYEIMRELGETRKDLKILTAVLAARPYFAENVDIVANILKSGTNYFYQRWESLPKFTEPARESRHRAPGMEQTFPFERFLLPFAKHVAHVAGLVARIDPEAALNWVKLYRRYFEELSRRHPHYRIRILRNDEVERLRQDILRDLWRIQKVLERKVEEVRKRGRGKRKGG